MSTQQLETLPQVGRSLATLEEIERAAIYIAKSGLFGVKTQEQAAALMLVAQSEGSHYARAAMAYDVIQGRPALKSSEILSRFQGSGGKIRYKQTTETCCEVELEHPQGGSILIKWDMERARKAGLAEKDTWKKYPAALLRARAVAEGVRALYPACLGGFHASEEIQDFEPAAKKAEPAPAEAIDLGKVIDATAKALEAPKRSLKEIGAAVEEAYERAEKGGEFKVHIGGTNTYIPPAPPPEEAQAKWVQPFCKWLRTLKDQDKMREIVKKYCPLDKIGTLGFRQANGLATELSTVFDVYMPAIDFGGEDF
jgi:hypothetical protein